MFTIGRLSTQAKVSADTLRYYEREALVKPASKSPGGYRLYDQDAVRRVLFIKHAQDCGFTLAEIKKLLQLRGRSTTRCGEIKKIAVEKKLQLAAKMKAMKTMSKALDHLIAECRDDSKSVADCPILTALDRANGNGKSRRA